MLMLDLTREAKRFLDTLPPKQFRQVVGKIISLMEDPMPQDSIQLKGNHRYRRADIGEYRIIYNTEDNCLKVYCIGNRNDSEVYQRFSK